MGYQPLGLLNTIYWLEEERESNEPVYSQYATQPSENLKLAKLVVRTFSLWYIFHYYSNC